jgi:hypothetical protein
MVIDLTLVKRLINTCLSRDGSHNTRLTFCSANDGSHSEYAWMLLEANSALNMLTVSIMSTLGSTTTYIIYLSLNWTIIVLTYRRDDEMSRV